MGVATIGSELLKGRLLNMTDVASLTGVSSQVVGQWVAGTKRPSKKNREILQHELGIPVDAWLTPEERDPERHDFAALLNEYTRRVQTLATEFLAAVARKTL